MNKNIIIFIQIIIILYLAFTGCDYRTNLLVNSHFIDLIDYSIMMINKKEIKELNNDLIEMQKKIREGGGGFVQIELY